MPDLVDRITEEWVNRGILPATDYTQKKEDEDSDEEKDEEDD